MVCSLAVTSITVTSGGMSIVIALYGVGLGRIKHIAHLCQLFGSIAKVEGYIHICCTIAGVSICKLCSDGIYCLAIADKVDRLSVQIGDGTVIHLNIHGNFFRLDAVFSDEERLLLQIGTAYSALPNSIAFKVHRHKSVDLIQSGTYLKFAVFCSGAIAINFFTVNSFVIAADLCAGGLIYILDVELSIFFAERSVLRSKRYGVLRFALFLVGVKLIFSGWPKLKTRAPVGQVRSFHRRFHRPLRR